MPLSHVDSPRLGALAAVTRALHSTSPPPECATGAASARRGGDPGSLCSSPAAANSRAAFAFICVAAVLSGCATFPASTTTLRAQSPAPPPALKPITRELAEQALSLADRPNLTAADFIDQPLADVKVEGNSTIPEIAILHEIKSKPGRPVQPDLIREDQASLLAKNWFFRVTTSFRVTDAGPVLVFHVVEKPILTSDAQFIGNDKIKTEVLLNLTGLRKGVAYDVSANKEAALRIQDHYREKGYYFAEVQLTKGDQPDQREVVFEIREGKKNRIHRVHFDGNRDISSAVLKTKLATKTVIGIPGTLLVIGGSYNPETIRNDADALVRYYHALGYFDAEVTAEEEFRKDKAEVHVHFHIKEGQRFKVRNIEIQGNQVLTAEQLRQKPELGETDYYNERLLKKDVQAMRDKYDDLGRLFAKVEPVPRFLEEPGWVDLVYEIDEDIPRRYGNININILGDHPHSTETLVRNQINRWIKPGELARMREIQGAQATLRGSQYWDKQQAPPLVNVAPVGGEEYLPPPLLARGQDGFDRVAPAFDPDHNPFAEFEGRITTARLPDGAAGTDEPIGRARVGRSALSTDLPAEAPQTDAGWQPPYNIDPAALFRDHDDDVVFRGQSIDSRGQPIPYDPLQTTSPQGDPFGDALRNPATPGFVDVDIDVTEARTGRLMFGVGVNSDAGVIGNIVLQEDNFNILRPPTSWADIVNGEAWRGRGQSFRLEIVPGTQVSRYLINWQDPYFLNSDFSLGLSGFFYNRYFDDWTEDRAGGRISIGRLLSRHWSGGVAIRLENVDIRDFRTPAPAIVTDVEGDNFLSTAQWTLTYDTRDSPFLPSEGHMVEASFEQAFGEFNYPRVDLQGVQYFTVYERPDGFGKHILQFRGQATWTGEDTPLFERLYAGGYSSFRGFEFRGVSPRQMGFTVGGEFLALGTVEYMLPLTADDNIRAVAFTDFGTVDEDVTFDRFRATAGFGFRLAIPAMGPAPIAIDFAWPIVQERFDEDRVFSFYVGFTR